MARLFRSYQARIAYVHDVIMAGISFTLALYLRLGDQIFWYAGNYLVVGSAMFVGVAAIVFASMKLYRGIWRYASLDDMISVARAATLTILIFLPLMFLVTRLESMPRSALVINWFVLMALLGGPRILFRIFKDRRLDTVLRREGRPRIPVLLVGADDGAELFIRDLARRDAEYKAVAIVSEKATRVGRHIHGVEVMGVLDDLPDVVARLARRGEKPHRIIMTKDRLDGEQVRGLLDKADELGLTLARLPSLTEFKGDVSDGIQVRPVDLEDLLGRPRTVLDRPAMKKLIAGRRVMVTGAGGTIGSELVRQITDLAPAHLSLLDSSEYHLYEIDQQVAENHPELARSAILGDVRDRARIEDRMARDKPELVFHAAALKHVPMVEAHPEEGVLTNVDGTINVADACRKTGVATMVLISSDKAVNPTSVMGATKRLAESYCQALDIAESGRRGGTRYVTVRFGNVIGSTGSVVPLFQRQLARGGPLTVTHEDTTRYFMTDREAVELVLQASAMGGREGAGKIFVLDMGQPVRILDLARQMIRLAGLRADVDVAIEFTGLRPGEKLHEELLHPSESQVPTAHKSIVLAAPRTADHAVLVRAVGELTEAARGGDATRTLEILRRLVPEYQPATRPGRRAAAQG